MRYLEAQQRRGGALIVIDPRRSATAQLATLHLQPMPGTDTALANGLLHVLLRDGLVDQAYVARAHRRLREACARVAAGYWPEHVERVTGVPERQLVRGGAPARRGARAASCSPAAARSSSRRASPTRSPTSTSRSRCGLPGHAGQRLRLPHRPGQRPGRPRARPEGRPAPRLPLDRRPGGAPRTSPASGACRPTRSRARASRPTSCSRAAAPRAASARSS